MHLQSTVSKHVPYLLADWLIINRKPLSAIVQLKVYICLANKLTPVRAAQWGLLALYTDLASVIRTVGDWTKIFVQNKLPL